MDAMSSKFFDDRIKQLDKENSKALVAAAHSSFFETMRTQLSRKDKALIKADIVAILVHLKPELVARVNDLDVYTVPQLNAMVRTIIYDINRIDDLQRQSFLLANDTCRSSSASSLGRICTA